METQQQNNVIMPFATMGTTQVLTIGFLLDNDKSYSLSLSNAKSGLTRTEVMDVAQKLLDADAIIKDGAHLAAVKEIYLTVTDRQELV